MFGAGISAENKKKAGGDSAAFHFVRMPTHSLGVRPALIDSPIG